MREAPLPGSVVLALELAEAVLRGLAWGVLLPREKLEVALPILLRGRSGGGVYAQGQPFLQRRGSPDPLSTASGSPAVSSWEQGLCFLGSSLICSGKTEHMVGPQLACGLGRETPRGPDTLG